MTKYALGGLFLPCWLSGILLAGNGPDQGVSIEEIFIKVKIHNASLREVLTVLEEKTGFQFVYNEKVLDKYHGIELQEQRESLGNILRQISRKTQLAFKRIGSNIHISERENGGEVIEEVLGNTPPINVTGKVTDSESGEALPGVNILEKGTNNGTVTDIDGNYRITVSGSSAVLLFSYIGYNTQEVNVNGRISLDIILNPDFEQLDEVVVIGYGTVKKSDLTGAVASLSEDNFNAGAPTSVDQLIQGRVAGVQITQSSAEPGGGVSIRIRGASSVNAGNEPLYVIDGLPLDNRPAVTGNGEAFPANQTPRNPLNSLHPSDIESIEVLKDASATAIYGSRGANGVILITTKKGEKGQLKVNYNMKLGQQHVARKLDLLNTSEYIQVMNQLEIDRGNNPLYTQAQIEEIGEGTDWQNEIFRKGFIQDHNLSFTGGSERTNYYISLNYTNQEGVVRNSGFERFTGRINLDQSAGDKFNFGINLNTSLTNDNFLSNGLSHNVLAGPINTALNTPPIFSVYDENGEYVIPGFVSLDNAVALTNELESLAETNRTFGNFYAEYDIIPSLTARVNLGTDRQQSRRDMYRSSNTVEGQPLGGVATILTGFLSNHLFEGTLNYNKTFGDNSHTINALAGYTFQQFDHKVFSGNTQGFPSDVIKTNNLSAGNDALDGVRSNTTQRRLQSFLGRLNYSLQNKYLFTASIRADGSSNFGKNNKYGIFPSFALGWKLSEESFMSGINGLEELKLRLSWGQIGNDDIGIANAIQTFAVNNADQGAVFDDNVVVGIEPARIANPDLKWETTQQFNVGWDIGIFEDRIYGSFDFFVKETKDLLLELPVPRASGFQFVTSNVGKVRNNGVEFMLESRNLVGEFKWVTNLAVTSIQNKVLDLGPLPEIILQESGADVIIRPGSPLFSYYGYQAEGIFQEGDDFSGQANAAPGVPRWRDANNDGQIDDEDRIILGDPFPDYNLGINNTFSYKNFDLSLFVEAVQGVEILNYIFVDAIFPNNPFRNRLAEPLLNRWTSTNPSNEWPSALDDTQYGGGPVNSYSVDDASFVRLKNVRLTYNFPVSNIRFLSNVSIYVAGDNLALLTNYHGFDPDVNSKGTANIKLDRNSYPAARTFLVGANISF